MYAVRGEGLSGKMDDLVIYIIVVYSDKTSFAASEHIMHSKCLHVAITFPLKVGGVNGITIT